jgi:hypothetical protein
MNKARVLLLALLDAALDIVVPTVVYLVLQPLGVPSVLALAAGGILIGGKAAFGKLTDTESRDPALVVGSTIASLIVLFGLHAIGQSDLVALLGGGLVQTAGVVTSIVRRRKFDGFALLVLTELAVGIALTFVTSGDPRFLVVRPAFYTLIAAGYVFGTTFGAKPFMYVVSRPMAVAGDPRRDIAFTNAWRNSAPFRKLERIMTVGFGVVLLAESVLRVVIAFRYSADEVVASSFASQLPVIILLVLFIIAFRVIAVPRLSRIVDGEQDALRKAEAH